MPSDSGQFFFNDLFTFEMANNHQGSVEHGLKIIKQIAEVSKLAGVRGAIKFQFRNLDTFVHPDFISNTKNKHIQRFLSTRLDLKDFGLMAQSVKDWGLLTMATPFDEDSVAWIQELDIDVIKVASCSAKDWPLLEEIAKLGKPVIASVGGLTLSEVDNLVSFLDHKYVRFAVMHCVAIYPTPEDKLQLNKIELFARRYPGVTIGFSTHEDPENYEAIKMAYAKGARVFERHVGVPGESPLNKYSSNPNQIGKWLDAWKKAKNACGSDKFPEAEERETADLRSLMRGTYAKRRILRGETITKNDVFFAIPLQEGQLTSGEFKSGMQAESDIEANESIGVSDVLYSASDKEIIYQVVHDVKGMLNEAHIPLNHEFTVDLSHHCGITRFREIGMLIINCINREYCKKYCVLLPGQKHPLHHHVIKEETFHIISGVLHLEIEGKKRTLHPGDTALINRGARHSFWTETGVIFEEVSTTHHNDDSFYADPEIRDMPREKRKTRLVNWGRHQFD